MGQVMRSLDWSQTLLGPVSQWAQSLKTAVGIILHSRYPMFVWWGAEYATVYNDAYRPILGATKHPQFLGQSAKDCWAEVWDVVGPLADSVLTTGEPTWSDDLLLIMDRYGYLEETYFTFSYSPIRDESGGVGGVFCAVIETTARVIGERRLRTLRELASNAAQAKTVLEACNIVGETLGKNSADIPFALLYCLEAEGKQARLVRTAGIEALTPASPDRVDLTQETDAYNLTKVNRTNTAEIIHDLTARFGTLPITSQVEPPSKAIVMPITQSGKQQLAGLLVLGISLRRAFDDEYQGFFDLVVTNISTAIANADAYEAERKRAEALVELDKAKTVFFSNISHEFRTPLTLMLSPLEETLANPTGPNPSDRSTLEIAHRNALRLLKLVNTLLDFSRIEAGRMEAVYEPTDLAMLTADLAGVFRSAIESAGMQLLVNCPPLPERIYVDREMWEKIVSNLLSNAFKFTFAGKIIVELRYCSNRIELEVRDTGIGIPATELPQIFERFHRVQGARGRTYEGSGIGLSLVRELVHLHGGTINVSSVVDKETSFIVSIPTGCSHLPQERIGAKSTLASTADSYVEREFPWLPDEKSGSEGGREQEKFPDSVTLSPSHSSSARILLVDDNADMRQYMKRLLSKQYEVQAVADGVAALASVHQQLPDLVITDVMMPKLDGFGLLGELRANPKTRALPIILLSARAGEESRVEGLEAGADDYLIKPFSARELLARVEANLKMAQMRQRYRSLVEATSSIVWVADGSGTILSAPAWGTFTGQTEQQYLGWGWLNAVHPDDCQPTLQIWTDALQKKTSWECEYRLLHQSGQYRYVYVRGIPILDTTGHVREWIGTVTDISDRKKAEEHLRLANERFELAATAVNCLIYDWDIERDVVTRTDGLTKILGYSLAEAEPTSKWWCELVHPEDLQRVRNEAAIVLTKSDRYTCEYRVLNKDKQYIYVVDCGIVAARDVDGQPIRIVGSTVNITERKQAESERAQLLEREQQHTRRLQKLTEASIVINSTSSLNERLQLITEKAREIIEAHQSVTSMTVDENWAQAIHTISMSDKYAQWQDYTTKPDGAGIYALVCRMQRPIRMTQAELEAHPAWRGFGKEAANHPPMRGWLAAPFTSRNGKNIGLIQLSDKCSGEFTQEDEAILVQLAQMASAAIDNAQLYEESQQANRVKDEFLAILSHELRSPLNPILGWAKLLQSRKLDNQKTAEALASIERNAKLQIELIDDLLDVSRILRGKLSLNISHVRLSPIIEAALETVRLAAIAKSIQIKTVLEPNSRSRDCPNQLRVAGDPNRLQQVIWNLLSNAIKFTPNGGCVEIRLEQVGDSVKIQVSDNGKGISPQFLPHVFDYFRQADASTTRTQGGLGLGLAIVRHLVELHGGTVTAASPGLGQGATFAVMLPMLNVEPEIKEDKPTDSEPDLTGVRVLVVEDIVDSREFLVFVLQQYGAIAMATASAWEAFEALQQFQPDVVVSDIGMPGEDGYTLIRKIRELAPEQGGTTPAIALTAYAKDEDRNKALSAGFQEHLSKPIEPAELASTIASLLTSENRSTEK
ncbi:response regulator [Scytonema sp. UIC 10036]|nr:ATP-binding protein [Scytonema sp. UIC 10036]MUG99980.1 response regulator [Scytonema sp. UIC 10036]